MPRSYPRFLFSDPKNIKSKGPFIVHTLNPRFIVRVDTIPNYDKGDMTHNGKYILFFLDGKPPYTDELEEATEALYKWLDAQIKLGEIKLPPNRHTGK
jgi:hypothetical protein